MAQPHRNSSFSYKSIHPDVQTALKARSNFTNRTQLAMPFVKATTTLNGAALSGFGFDGNMFGFTLGLHAVNKDAAIQDIYSDNDGNALIGYTYVLNDQGNTNTQYIYAKATNDAFLNRSSQILGEVSSTRKIPPPGITNVTVGRIRNGVVSSADINFVVPTLSQLEMLHRTFLVPGIGMVLEWGQQFSVQPGPEFGEKGLSNSNIDSKMFPWYDRNELLVMVSRLAKNEIGLDEIMNCYVHPTEGQYQWMFGRVANFTTKATGDGSYDCMVKIVGPAEDSWAYSVRNTAVPSTKIRGERTQLCTTGINNVESYFNKTSTSTNPVNFFTVLENMATVPGERTSDEQIQKRFLPGWEGHVLKLEQGNLSGGEGSDDSDASEDTLGDSEDAYFITWRFFVNVILNHPEYGLKSIFSKAGFNEDDLKKISILRSYGNNIAEAGELYINDEYENFVGNSKYLRSTDLNTMIIVNESAASYAESFLRQNNPELTESVTQRSSQTDAFLQKGDFIASDTTIRTANNEACPANNDRGLLSAGVWLNHKAIIQSFVSANTITEGLTNLLNRMNAATSNFWNLTLDVSEPIKETCGGDGTPISYTITDMNYRESSDVAVKDFIDNVYLFNKYVRQVGEDKLGSEVTECTVDMNLPKRLFSQIATLGLSQTGNEHSSIVGENDSLREMFGITQLTDRNTGMSADLTAPSRDRSLPEGSCVEPVDSPSVGTGAGSTPSSAPGDGLTEQDTQAVLTALKAYQQLNICTTPACSSSLAAVDSQPAGVEERQLSGDCRSLPIGPASNPSNITAVQGLSNSAKRKGWEGKNVPLVQTNLTQAEAVRRLKELNCTKELIIIILSVMRSEQWAGSQYSTKNYNFSGYDLTNAGWDFNPELHNGYVYRREGGTGICKTYISFKSLDAAVYGKVMSVINRPIIRSITDARTFARAYYQAWNGYGARVLSPLFRGASTRQRGASVDASDNIFKDFDASQLSNWESNYTSTKREVEGLPIWNSIPSGTRTIDQIIKPASLTVASSTPTPTPTPTLTSPPTTVAAPNENISLLEKGQDLLTIAGVRANFTGRGNLIPSAPSNCTQCIQQKQQIKQLERSQEAKRERAGEVDRAREQLPNLTRIFRYLEIFPERMVANITNNADGNISNAFGASPGALSINAEITLPGINGLRVGELFWIDKIPSFYRIFGAFQIMNIQDVIGPEGWNTKISAKFNYLGTSWKRKALEILNTQ